MKNLLLLLILGAFVFASCGDSTVNWSETKYNPQPKVFDGDPEDENGDDEEYAPCTSENEVFTKFLDDVSAALGIDLYQVMLNDEALSCAFLACLESNYNNHGAFVSCIAHLTNDMMKAGIITGKQKGVIQNIAGKSDIGKPAQSKGKGK